MTVDHYGHSASHGALTGLGNDDHPAYPKGQMAYAEVTEIQTFTASGDIAGLSVTVNVPVGRRIRITGGGTTKSGVDARSIIGIYEDGAEVGRAADHQTYASNQTQEFEGSCVRTPTTGQHTYKLRYDVISGAGHSITAYPVNPTFILVEDIGPAT